MHNQTTSTKYFESLINIKKQLLKNEKIIKKYCPNYLEKFYEDTIYQRFASTLDLKKKFREQFHDKKIEDTFIEDKKDSLKQFYSFFNDKSFKLDKNVYFKLKLLVSGHTALRLNEIEEILPQYSLLKTGLLRNICKITTKYNLLYNIIDDNNEFLNNNILYEFIFFY